jgi:ABC-type uncharacterized transport system permease subunit
MNFKVVGSNVAMMIVFAAIGLTQFTENVRNVQILGLFASGAVFGVSFATIIAALRARRKE